MVFFLRWNIARRPIAPILACYGGAALALAVFLAFVAPRDMRWELAAIALGGLAFRIVVEYALRRFVLHAVAPFCDRHAEQHRRQSALGSAPTVVGASPGISLKWAASGERGAGSNTHHAPTA